MADHKDEDRREANAALIVSSVNMRPIVAELVNRLKEVHHAKFHEEFQWSCSCGSCEKVKYLVRQLTEMLQ
jgi:hypothetical protein